VLGNLRVPPGGHRRYVLDTYLQLVHERSLGRFRTLRIRQRRGTRSDEDLGRPVDTESADDGWLGGGLVAVRRVL
jgi:hypothetical protein